MIRVNEVFQSIQGEAAFTGSPSLFVRLQGCPVGCHWCDTKHTWDASGEPSSAEEVLAKTADSAAFFEADDMALAEMIAGYPAHLRVVITGGEPCIYDLRGVTSMLIDSGRDVQIETSGAFPIMCHPSTWVTVSPKIGMAGGFGLLQESLNRANEIKMPVGKVADIERLAGLNVDYRKVWLQPISQSAKATSLCVNEAIKRGWRVSAQVHKFLGAR